MRVMAVTHQSFTGGMGFKPASGGPEIGVEYIVLEECIGIVRDGTRVKCFRLSDFPKNELYDQRNFEILPDATAEEMEQEVREAILI